MFQRRRILVGCAVRSRQGGSMRRFASRPCARRRAQVRCRARFRPRQYVRRLFRGVYASRRIDDCAQDVRRQKILYARAFYGRSRNDRVRRLDGARSLRFSPRRRRRVFRAGGKAVFSRDKRTLQSTAQSRNAGRRARYQRLRPRLCRSQLSHHQTFPDTLRQRSVDGVLSCSQSRHRRQGEMHRQKHCRGKGDLRKYIFYDGHGLQGILRTTRPRPTHSCGRNRGKAACVQQGLRRRQARAR